MKIKARSAQSGMTLVELTVAIVITMVVATGIVVFMISGLHNYGEAAAKAELLSQAQTALDKVSNDILLSATADLNNRIDDANPPVTGDPNSWESDADTVVLATVVEDSAGEIIYQDPVQYVSYKNNVVYYLDGTTLYRRVLAANVTNNKATTTCPSAVATATCPGDSIILEHVTSFVVTYRDHLDQAVSPDEARSVEVAVTLQDSKYKNAKVSYKIRTVFRNG